MCGKMTVQGIEKGRAHHMKTHGNARFIDCPGVTSDGIGGHAMRDGCWSCAPYWERIPLCPREEHDETGTRKLAMTETIGRDGKYRPENAGIGYCKTCHKHFTLTDAARR